MTDEFHAFYVYNDKHCLECGRSFADVIPDNSYCKETKMITKIYECPQCESVNTFISSISK